MFSCVFRVLSFPRDFYFSSLLGVTFSESPTFAFPIGLEVYLFAGFFVWQGLGVTLSCWSGLE